jgi:hypothetical protein
VNRPAPALDPVLLEPKRLQICGALGVIDEMEFGTLRDLLGVADSVMSKHLKSQAGHGRDAQGRRHHGRRHPEQAKIAEDAGAVAVMALERVPADIRAQGGVSRMSDPDMIDGIIAAVSIPVMAKARIGHFVEAQVLQSLGVDYIDESEVLTPADYANHIDKWAFTVPFVCGATNLGEALRRITEGAAMIRSKGEAGTGDVSNATTHMRQIRGEINRLRSMTPDELYVAAKELQAPYDLVGGRAGRQAAGRPLHRGRHRHPGRRGDDDAARCRGRLRRVGDLQVRQPGPAGRGDRQGDHLLRRPRRHRQGLSGPGRGHGRHQRRGDSRSPTASPSAAGDRRAGGESTVIDKLLRAFELFEPLRDRLRGGLPAYGSCAGMILLADRVTDATATSRLWAVST